MTPKAMPTLHEVLGPRGPSSTRSPCCLPVSCPPGAPIKIAPLLVAVGSATLLVNNGRLVCGGVVICGVRVEDVEVEVNIGGIDNVVVSEVKVLDVLESESVSDSVDEVDVLLVVLELVVRAAGGEKVGGAPGGGGGKDVLSSSSSSSSFTLNLSSSSSSLSRSKPVPSRTRFRPQMVSSSSCCLAATWSAARCTLLRRAL